MPGNIKSCERLPAVEAIEPASENEVPDKVEKEPFEPLPFRQNQEKQSKKVMIS
jgi:hypothetical protein